MDRIAVMRLPLRSKLQKNEKNKDKQIDVRGDKQIDVSDTLASADSTLSSLGKTCHVFVWTVSTNEVNQHPRNNTQMLYGIRLSHIH